MDKAKNTVSMGRNIQGSLKMELEKDRVSKSYQMEPNMKGISIVIKGMD